MIYSYRDLDVYKRSYEIALKVYKITEPLPKDELYGLNSQLKKAATSIPLNIAEGYGKKDSPAEFKRYLYMSKGSCNEMMVLISFCKDLGFIDAQSYETLTQEYDEIGKMLSGLINKWFKV